VPCICVGGCGASADLWQALVWCRLCRGQICHSWRLPQPAPLPTTRPGPSDARPAPPPPPCLQRQAEHQRQPAAGPGRPASRRGNPCRTHAAAAGHICAAGCAAQPTTARCGRRCLPHLGGVAAAAAGAAAAQLPCVCGACRRAYGASLAAAGG
jgi:hypothetical protein